MDLITFVGTGLAKPTIYTLGDQAYETCYVAEALIQWLKPSRVIVIVTEGAKRGPNWVPLQQALVATGTTLQHVPVPDGRSEQEQWTLFEAMSDAVQPGSEIVMDVTHGFRSLPLMSLVAVSYLRVVKKVAVQQIVYGAFDAQANGRTPVFDLTPFVRLFDWSIAADKFLTTGNGFDLAKLVDAQNRPQLKAVRESLIAISQGLHLLRPRDVMARAAALSGDIDASRESIRTDEPALHAILQSVEQGYGSLALKNPDANVNAFVTKQLELAEWYLAKRQYIQCVAVAREWLPTLLCAVYADDPFEKLAREDKELLLDGGTRKENDVVVAESPRKPEWLKHPLKKSCCDVWANTHKLANLRNDLLHAGFRKKPQAAKEAIAQIELVVTELRKIHDQWKR